MALQLKTFENTDELYNFAAQFLQQKVKDGAKTFGLATGGTMQPLYQVLRQSDVDFSGCTSFNLDEYIGLPIEHPESYFTYMQKELFEHKPFSKSYLPNGLAEDIDAEVAHYNELLAQNPIDVQLLGVGENGHIGFNEPGTPFSEKVHAVTLTESTREANARFFNSIAEVPEKAITMGIANILEAKEILLIAVGEKKRAALESLVHGEVTIDSPITVLQQHGNVVVLTDLNISLA
ncbi:glucosamine-6-phosphate deaminase [Metasolibacillus sp.]|uniref:glucosamine-6-phosphate deaminase n=1 Tax=Metasolibacillus sp. TaxID=2703680 RepID=UPI0025DD101F|nr:glucosamine-6-phosphate deaminase [Metasolibacillus sp.]MCT6923065.1 glucosamine-6-phosphate deaminase [Metasolibacillus sp.]MCT6939303.1 glucosamine-6-phosphate deaminase [Metasolibacillus sp.]